MEQEMLSKTLKDQQKKIKDAHEPRMKQIEMFNSVKKLLKCKAKLQQSSPTELNNDQNAVKVLFICRPTLNLQSEEVDRLVLA
jgi:hypothetical protein